MAGKEKEEEEMKEQDMVLVRRGEMAIGAYGAGGAAPPARADGSGLPGHLIKVWNKVLLRR